MARDALVWAARRAGLIYTPISTHLKRGEVLYIVRNCEAKAVICSSSLADIAQELRNLMPEIAHWFMVNAVRPV
jgi:long-chain acyl-CoA synthetase